jgi:probable F420-dependent oxidoreductase
VKIETGLGQQDLGSVGERVKRAEELGYDSVSTAETSHNPFIGLALAAEHSSTIELSTSIAQSFVRSPTTMAYAAFDIQRFSRGRLYLGLGSQVKGQIERRFGMPWVAPGPRMRDYISAMRAVFECWQENKQLNYQGTHYKLSVMTPNHRPSPLPEGIPFPKIGLAAVGPYMCRLAGEVCDGVRLHTFNTEAYLYETAIPRLKQGARKAGRTMADIDISGGGMIATGPTEADVERAKAGVKWSIAFYGSTRTYLEVWKLHGWEETGLKLHELSVSNGWDKMSSLITDEMVDTFAAVGTYDIIGEKIIERFGNFATRVGLPLPSTPEQQRMLAPSIKVLKDHKNPWL